MSDTPYRFVSHVRVTSEMTATARWQPVGDELGSPTVVPDPSLLPRTLVIEALVQAAGEFLARRDSSRGAWLVAAIDDCSVSDPPGTEPIQLHVRLVRAAGRFAWIDATARSGRRVVARARVTMAALPGTHLG